MVRGQLPSVYGGHDRFRMIYLLQEGLHVPDVRRKAAIESYHQARSESCLVRRFSEGGLETEEGFFRESKWLFDVCMLAGT
jgi:hypothetical protein